MIRTRAIPSWLPLWVGEEFDFIQSELGLCLPHAPCDPKGNSLKVAASETTDIIIWVCVKVEGCPNGDLPFGFPSS